ncbi:MAG: hypothetical protein IJT54_01890 [Candidatus Methanomethylophilaceae archaeon]|nr:hypothetical protein [Candidatus Methanomethylophilaceae archaeon]
MTKEDVFVTREMGYVLTPMNSLEGTKLRSEVDKCEIYRSATEAIINNREGMAGKCAILYMIEIRDDGTTMTGHPMFCWSVIFADEDGCLVRPIAGSDKIKGSVKVVNHIRKEEEVNKDEQTE